MAIQESERFIELRDAYNTAVEAMEAKSAALDAATAVEGEERDTDAIEKLERELTETIAEAEALSEQIVNVEARDRARAKFKKMPASDTKREAIAVDEPDLYEKGGRSFMHDLYQSTLKNDHAARERIGRHQALEVEKRAVATATLGGIIPPQYLVDMYAKASRNGRVFADQVNHKDLPDQGMSLIVPRLTQGLAVASQATESAVVTTQDPTETDLTVPVRTLAGYSPVSRQTLERSGYADEILFEDLLARYWAQLDTQAINGAGTSGTLLGALNTAGIATSTAGTATVAGVWPKIADLIQQINANVGGLGYVADKIIMHPRRWGFFAAALDGQNRPLMPVTGAAFNVVGGGQEAGYGFVGNMHGLPVYTDANIPTTLGAGTNEDRIIVVASPVVHLWERSGDPVTLSFEQQAGTSLQVQLVSYGYVAFSAGRFPGATGVVSGAGLVAPTF